MKKLGFLLILITLYGCGKNEESIIPERSKLVLSMTYNSNPTKKSSFEKKSVYKNEVLYSQFGDYITSVTPAVFVGKFLDMRLFNWTEGNSIPNYGFNLIDNNTPLDSTNRLADFSNNATVVFNPDLGDFTLNRNTTLNLFLFIPLFYYQEFELPSQYNIVAELTYLNFGGETINLESFSIGGVRNGSIIKGSSEPFIAPVFDSTWTGFNGNFPETPKNYVFGNTDSTYIFYSNGQSSINDPLAQGGYIVRNSLFNEISLPDLAEGEQVTLNGILTFDLNNLIQIYAGLDNIAYTSDDIFVYAPNFWERMHVNIEAF